MRICKYCNEEKEKFNSKFMCYDCKRKRYKEKHPYNSEKEKEIVRLRMKNKKDSDPVAYEMYIENKKKRVRERERRKSYELLYKNMFDNPEKYIVLTKEEKRQLKNEYAKQYREKNKEIVYKKVKKWRDDNVDYVKKQSKKYYQKNKERDKEKKNKWQRERLSRDPQAKLKALLRTRIYTGLKYYSKNGKTNSCAEYGIDFKAIYDRIGPRPSNEYHLDHIIPISLFDLDIKEHVRLANCPENLRWVYGEENLSKSDNIFVELIINEPVLVDICKMLNVVILI